MAKRKCSTCLFKDQCDYNHVCDFYSPMNEAAEDRYIDKLINDNRESFLEDWLEYANEYND